VNNRMNDLPGLATLHSSNGATRENNWTGEFNVRYVNPEFDSLITRFYSTIRQDERMQVLGQIIYHISDQVNILGLYYSTQPVVIGRRLTKVGPNQAALNGRQSWNAHEWDLVE